MAVHPTTPMTVFLPPATKPTTPLKPVIEATQALKSTFGSAAKGTAASGMSSIPPNRPKVITQRVAGHVLPPATPVTLKSDPRLTSQVQATVHPTLVTVPPIVAPKI